MRLKALEAHFKNQKHKLFFWKKGFMILKKMKKDFFNFQVLDFWKKRKRIFQKVRKFFFDKKVFHFFQFLVLCFLEKSILIFFKFTFYDKRKKSINI